MLFYRASVLGLFSRPTWAAWGDPGAARASVPTLLRPLVVVRGVDPRRFGRADPPG